MADITSLEAARKEIAQIGNASQRTTTTITKKNRTDEIADKQGPCKSSVENSTIRVDSEYFNGGENVSRVIYVSPWCVSYDTPPTSTGAAVSGSCGNAEKIDLKSSETRKSKNETLDSDILSVGSNCSYSRQKGQQSSSGCIRQKELKLELNFK